jgi:hypothetical protein
MFGYNLLELYFMINLIYTVITFIFLHNIIAEKVYNEYKETTSKSLTSGELTTSMNVFYVFSVGTGTFRLANDFLRLIIVPKKCIWLYRIYGKDE